MRDLEKRAVRRHWTFLLENLNTEYGLLDFLFQNGKSSGIDWDAYEKFRDMPVRHQRVERLMLKLLKTCTLDTFLDALDFKGVYTHIAYRIRSTYREFQEDTEEHVNNIHDCKRDGAANHLLEHSVQDYCIHTEQRGVQRHGADRLKERSRVTRRICAVGTFRVPMDRRFPHPLQDVRDVGRVLSSTSSPQPRVRVTDRGCRGVT